MQIPLVFFSLLVVASATSPGPLVNLGYATYFGSIDSQNITSFVGIRYAAPPTGQLRWQAPVLPTPVVGIQAAISQPPRCYQGALGTNLTSNPILASREIVDSEDCLFLSVYSPTLTPKTLLPVVLWIHGGGYAIGAASDYNGAELVLQSNRNVVVVVIQYRLGLFGFLAGKQVHKYGVANAGLLDQDLALRWVNRNIHKFGGDQSQVTIWGQSAGAGSVLQHALAHYGNTQPSLFRAAITSSTYVPPQYAFDHWVPQTIFHQVSELAGCSNSTALNCLRALNGETLQSINYNISVASFQGSPPFLPVVDGSFIVKNPLIQLQEGKVNGDILLSMTNTNEGIIFVSSAVEYDVAGYTRNLLPALSPNQSESVARAYGSLGSSLEQVYAIMTEFTFVCPTYYALPAFSGKSYKGQFAVPPALHGDDISYYFPSFHGFGTPTPRFNSSDFINAFVGGFLSAAVHLDPNVKLSPNIAPVWPKWTTARHEMLFNKTDFTVPRPKIVADQVDQALLDRCEHKLDEYPSHDHLNQPRDRAYLFARFFMSQPQSIDLSAHIRGLLLDYVLAHITADYIQFTEQANSELCRYEQIPLVDPNSLTIPPDPFDTLLRIHAFPSLIPSQEKFQSTPDAIKYVKSVLSASSGKPPSARAVSEENTSETRLPLYEQFLPVLSARARRETPRPGAKLFSKSLPNSHNQFLHSQAIQPVVVEPVVEELVKRDDVLDVVWKLRQDQREDVRAALLGVMVPMKKYKNRHLDFSSRPESPPLRTRDYEPEFIPIFPRRRRVGSGVREGDPPPLGLGSLKDLSAMILPPVKLEEVEPDFCTQNMIIVNGWSAFCRSFPNQLFIESQMPYDRLRPPVLRHVPVRKISLTSFGRLLTLLPPPYRPTKMDVVEIPRSKRIGGQRKKPDLIGQGSHLGSFLAPHVRMHADFPVLFRPPDESESIIGNAGSTNAATTKDVLDADINALYGERQDIRDWIMKERVDEKQQLLMEVPLLPPPSHHGPNSLFLPSHLSQLLTTPKEQVQQSPNHVHQFLKRTKGLLSSTVELSWDPIPARTPIATLPDILQVENSFHDDMFASPVQALLLTVCPAETTDEDVWSSRYSKHCFEGTLPFLDLDAGRCEIALSRRRPGAINVSHKEIISDDLTDESTTKRKSSQDNFDDSGIAFDFVEPDFQTPPVEMAMNVQQSFYQPISEPTEDEHVAYQTYPYYHDKNEFLALSFDSAQPSQLIHDAHSDETYAAMFEPHRGAIINDTAAVSQPSLPDIVTHSLGIFEFAKLRAKRVSESLPPQAPAAPPDITTAEAPANVNTLPEELHDRNTVSLPSIWNAPSSRHKYLVSMEILQRQALVRTLRSCCVDLVERESMSGVDIILDPHSAIIFSNLLTLPSECVDLVKRIAQESWRYSRLFVIFNAYPDTYSYRTKESTSRQSELSAYTPPVIKALRRFRRDIDIMEGSGHLRQDCIVQHAFADTVNDSAMFVRYLGDYLEANDASEGAVWGDRAWFNDDIPEGESDLAAADGMNLFASLLILCQIGLEEFLELTPDERVAKFAIFVGAERMSSLNRVIEQRFAALQPSESEMDVG
ncbi:hypothetical protein MIND_01009300 [Mycena indigotica]|uniref:Carboxylesterase type B domain-containing protein n=1 Tax=Mycena indigotica TaxID=2126181 RepID=A0A8H6S9L9_9AGAR|nr:uncharacterized protein MIND_01009300 [Mycena indigotica]KAF7294720.1 hypothetical protein MIND_01009300 [Mycena indigotica]